MISSTCLPWSRKYSAIDIAYAAPFSRISGGWSAGAATTTARAMPSLPRMRVDVSLTSRPRSADQADDHDVGFGHARHHAEQNALPTPLPANRRSRCPRPTVSRPLIARTPTSSVCRIGARFSGLIDGCTAAPGAPATAGPCRRAAARRRRARAPAGARRPHLAHPVLRAAARNVSHAQARRLRRHGSSGITRAPASRRRCRWPA